MDTLSIKLIHQDGTITSHWLYKKQRSVEKIISALIRNEVIGALIELQPAPAIELREENNGQEN